MATKNCDCGAQESGNHRPHSRQCAVYDTCKCGGDFVFNRNCGAKVCDRCDNHKNLDRCYCGWSKSGGNGYTELVELGETIEPEDY